MSCSQQTIQMQLSDSDTGVLGGEPQAINRFHIRHGTTLVNQTALVSAPEEIT